MYHLHTKSRKHTSKKLFGFINKAVLQPVFQELSTCSSAMEAQYALSGYEQPIGVSDYQLTKAIPDNLRSTLPSIEKVEEDLNNIIVTK